MQYRTPSFITRKGIILSRKQVPFDSALTFYAGVAKYRNGYVMLFRNDYGFCQQDFDDYYAGVSDNTVPRTNIGVAFSQDGICWEVEQEPVFHYEDEDITRAYDPRITSLDGGEYAVCFAVDSRHGTRAGIALTQDFRKFEVKSLSVPENRNMVLFPERINGKFIRLERPFTTGGKQNYSIWLSASEDLVHWGESKLILPAENVLFANSKIGPAAPPVKTDEGWLTLFHAVEDVPTPISSWQRDWRSRYYAGAMLLASDDPSKIIAMGETPLIVPETEYERKGFRGEVIFPGSLIRENDDTLKIYYGAADTVECLAEAKLDDLLSFLMKV